MLIVILYYIVIYFVTLKITMTLTLLLLLSSLITVTTFIPLLQEVYGQNNDTQPQQQTPSQTTESASASSPIDCKSIASQIGSNAFSIQNPNPEICDISIMRHSPQVTDQNGT